MPDIRLWYDKDFIAAYHLDGEKTLTIKSAQRDEVFNPGSAKIEAKVTLAFEETDKKMVLNATNRDRIAKMYGYDHTKWPGQKIVLHKETTRLGRQPNVPCVRVKVAK